MNDIYDQVRYLSGRMPDQDREEGLLHLSMLVSRGIRESKEEVLFARSDHQAETGSRRQESEGIKKGPKQRMTPFIAESFRPCHAPPGGGCSMNLLGGVWLAWVLRGYLLEVS